MVFSTLLSLEGSTLTLYNTKYPPRQNPHSKVSHYLCWVLSFWLALVSLNWLPWPEAGHPDLPKNLCVTVELTGIQWIDWRLAFPYVHLPGRESHQLTHASHTLKDLTVCYYLSFCRASFSSSDVPPLVLISLGAWLLASPIMSSLP